MTWSAGAVLTAAQLNAYVPQEWTAWTPTVTATAGTFGSVAGSGRYILIGKTVLWDLSITITTVGTASGGVVFTLPVTAIAGDHYLGGGREITTTGFLLQVTTTAVDATLGRVFVYDNTGAIGAGRTLALGGTYEAA